MVEEKKIKEVLQPKINIDQEELKQQQKQQKQECQVICEDECTPPENGLEELIRLLEEEKELIKRDKEIAKEKKRQEKLKKNQ